MIQQRRNTVNKTNGLDYTGMELESTHIRAGVMMISQEGFNPALLCNIREGYMSFCI